MTNDSTMRPCQVIAAYDTPYSDPIMVQAGDEMTVGERESKWPGWLWCTAPDGKSGWVPASYLKRDGDLAVALCDYDATELTVRVGEQLLAGKEESDWIWCTNQKGHSGWVPVENLHLRMTDEP